MDIKSINYVIKRLSQEAKNAYKKLVNEEKLKGGNNVDYDFSNFSPLREVFRKIYYGEVLIPAVEGEQDIFKDMIKMLKNYRPRTIDNKKKKDALVINAQNFYDGREMIIEAFKNKLFPFYSGNYYHDLGEVETSESDNEGDMSPRGAVAASPKNSLDSSRSGPINNEGINPEIIKKCFGFNSLDKIN